MIKRLSHLPGGKYFFMYATNKLRYFIYKAVRSTKVAYPSTVMIELSAHCNLKCTTCPREYGYGEAMDKGYMPVENAKKIIDELWPYLDSVGLTGMGETLLYKDLLDIADYIKNKNKGIILSLSTNATTPKFIETIRPLVGKIDTIQISIDGLGETYNQIRHNANFETLDRNLRSLKDLFSQDTTFMLNMVVTKENYHQMAAMIEYSQEIGINYMNFTLFNLASLTSIPSNYYDFYKSEEFLSELKKMRETQKRITNVEVSHWDYETPNGFRKCSLPWSHFAISWNGEVPPCCAKPFPKELSFGNVAKDGVLQVLNSKEFMAFRKLWYRNQTPNFCKKCHYIDIEPINTDN
ncbi:radical SAM protein [Bacteroidales bacterium OttesenSCG-928-M11]|nr:radical SAM protein [Bacteroidales bacterium OttesenSCG-928-M11]